MSDYLYIPKEVKDSISEHIRNSIKKAVEGYPSASEDEDTLTGQLGILLKIETQKVFVENPEIQGFWKWSINYYKFRGRGSKATERFLGADGIFELLVNDSKDNKSPKKSLLFQAKNNLKSDRLLYEQCIKLSTWREAAFVVNYTPEEFQAFFIDDVIKSKGIKSQISRHILLSELLNDHFLNCHIGDTELKYNAKSGKLFWRAYNNRIVSTRFSVRNRVTIKIDSPSRKNNLYKNIDDEIPNNEIYNYRMKADPEQILSLESEYNEKDINVQHQKLSLAYHTDIHNNLDELNKQILNRRQQEINKAKEYIKTNYKKNR